MFGSGHNNNSKKSGTGLTLCDFTFHQSRHGMKAFDNASLSIQEHQNYFCLFSQFLAKKGKKATYANRMDMSFVFCGLCRKITTKRGRKENFVGVTFSGFASWLILATEISGQTVYCENVDVPSKQMSKYYKLGIWTPEYQIQFAKLLITSCSNNEGIKG